MPGSPVEAMVGTVLLGGGVLIAYSAYLNVSPLEIIRQVIQTGKFIDPHKLPKLVGTTGAGVASAIALEGAVVAGIKPKNPDLANRLQQGIVAYVSNPNSTTLAALQKLVDEAKSKGFTKEADLVTSWLANNQPASLAAGGPITAVPVSTATQPLDVPSGADFGTTNQVGALVFDPSTGNWVSPV